MTYKSYISETGAWTNGVFRIAIEEHTQPYRWRNDLRLTYADTLADAARNLGLSPWVDPPVVPISPRQLRLGLIERGIMPETVAAWIESIPDETAKAKAKAEWEYANEVKPSHPLVVALAAELDIDIPTFFRAAVKL